MAPSLFSSAADSSEKRICFLSALKPECVVVDQFPAGIALPGSGSLPIARRSLGASDGDGDDSVGCRASTGEFLRPNFRDLIVFKPSFSSMLLSTFVLFLPFAPISSTEFQ
jgi:hypothetical protein